MKTSLQKAERVAARISRKLGTPSWFLGIGIQAFDTDTRRRWFSQNGSMA